MLTFHLRQTLVASVLVFLSVGSMGLGEEPLRTWSDKTGRFEVEAKLVSETDGKVKLLKADGLVVEVPVAALSEADQKHLANREAANPFAGGTPLLEGPTQAMPAPRKPVSASGLLGNAARVKELQRGKSLYIELNAPVPPLAADPLPYERKFKAFSQPIEKLDAYARISAPVLVDPEQTSFVVSTHRVGNRSNSESFGRLYLVSPQQPPQVVLDLPQSLSLLDHHVASDRTLAVLGVDSPSERGGDLVLFEKLSTGSPRAIARWHVPEWQKPGFKPKVEFARMLDQERAVVQVNYSVYLWNLVSGQPSTMIERVPATGKLEVSNTGKYLAVASSGGCALVDLNKGTLLGKVPFPSSLTPDVCFSPNGKLLALTAGNQYLIWDLENARPQAEATLENSFGDLVGWVTDSYLLTSLGGLVDIELGMPLWHYHVSSGKKAVALNGGLAVVTGYDMRLLHCLPLPHPPVAAVAEKLASNTDELMLLRPGSEVSLRVEAVEGVDKQEILMALQKAVEHATWKVNPQAEIEVVATIGRGEKQKLHYRTLGLSFPRSSEEVSIKPYTASLEIRLQDAVQWSKRSRNIVPSLIQLERGESIKQAIKKYEKPDLSYFEYLNLPPKVLRPEVRKAIGRSHIHEGSWK